MELVLCYGSEMWAINTEMKRFNILEINYLRRSEGILR